ncbi:MAG: heavy metal translocating P-type ATPase [Planctomycetaceae bacterium]
MTDTAIACDYCGLPVPGAAVESDAVEEPQFCCFGCRFADAIMRERDDESTTRWTLTRLGISIFFAMNVMVFTMARWSGDVYDVSASEFSTSLHELFRYLCLLLTIPVMGMLGLPLLNHAWQGLKQRQLTSELLIVTGVVAAFAFSTVSVFRGVGHTYFEVACMVLVLVTLGRWFEATGRMKATAALDKLQQLLPDFVTRVSDDTEEKLPVSDVTIGDQIRIRAGERFPVDGQIAVGRTTVDQQVFTGESVPIERSVGDPVLAGTVNMDGDVVIQATAAAGAGSFAKLLEVLREARNSRGHYQRIADRVSQWFVPAVACVAIAVFVVHLERGPLEALMSSLSVALIACPCALGLATPLALWTALSHAANQQVLFRNGTALERLAGVKAVRFDKTGTLTDGSPHVHQIIRDDETDAAFFNSVVRQLSHSSTHVYSQAIYRSLDGEPVVDTNVTDIQSISGSGVTGTIAITDEPISVSLGSAAFVDFDGIRKPSDVTNFLATDPARESAFVFVAWKNKLQGLFVIDEQLRPESSAAIESCKELELEIAVLTGDRLERAARWSERLGINVAGALSPSDKVQQVHAARKTFGSIAMIGDGINDAPALAASDVGITLGCGADVTRDSAEVCIMSDDLSRVPWAIELAKKTRRIVRQNLAWAFGYNTFGIALAATGRLNPAIAAGLMLASSLIVIINSLRLNGDSESAQWEPTTGSGHSHETQSLNPTATTRIPVAEGAE